MTLFDRLMERHKNPLSWLLRVIFFLLFCVGIWQRDRDLLVVALVGLATGWFWLPKTEVLAWSEAFIDGEKEWTRRPMDTEKVLVGVFATGTVSTTTGALVGDFFGGVLPDCERK